VTDEVVVMTTPESCVCVCVCVCVCGPCVRCWELRLQRRVDHTHTHPHTRRAGERERERERETDKETTDSAWPTVKDKSSEI